MVLTLFIGYLIWSLVVWNRGTTPAKQMLGMRVVRLQDGELATWGTMFLRQIVGQTMIGGVANAMTMGIISLMPLWDRNNQQLWDKVAGTIVIDDLRGELV